jgi:hypothetical protein
MEKKAYRYRLRSLSEHHGPAVLSQAILCADTDATTRNRTWCSSSKR